jgi:hypothetical protein
MITSNRNREMLIALCLASLLTTVACQLGAPATLGMPTTTVRSTPTDSGLPTPTPAHTRTTGPARYDGLWTGTTSQGRPIAVQVAGSKIVSAIFEIRLEGQGWHAETTQSHPVVGTIADDHFSLTLPRPRGRGFWWR